MPTCRCRGSGAERAGKDSPGGGTLAERERHQADALEPERERAAMRLEIKAMRIEEEMILLHSLTEPFGV